MMTTSHFRQNIYKLLDRIAETGIPLEIGGKGRRFKIVPEVKIKKLAHLKKRSGLKGKPEDLVHLDWTSEWNG
ncbi:MAG: type II toxin-antitoxin system Phd/YefM family antitoxin [Candidatus Omnitrophica bacterium]|nr:type II toxin-antitoxin system Phd/YefM family antitoxin [Candidatus Omnitrophota bacterium]